MLVYFFCLTYGMYFTTIYQFISRNRVLLMDIEAYDERLYYKGRRAGSLYSIYFQTEANARLLDGTKLADC